MQVYKEQYIWLCFGRENLTSSAADARADGAVIIGAGYKIGENKNYLTNTFTLANNIDYPWCDFYPFDPLILNHIRVEIKSGEIEYFVNETSVTKRRLPSNFKPGYFLMGTNSNGATVEKIYINGKAVEFGGCLYYGDVAISEGAKLPAESFYNIKDNRLVRTFNAAGTWCRNVAMMYSEEIYSELTLEYDVKFSYVTAEEEHLESKDPFGSYPIGPKPQAQWTDWTVPSAVRDIIWHKHSFEISYMAYGVSKSLFLSLPSCGGVRFSSEKPSTREEAPEELTAVFESEYSLGIVRDNDYRFRGNDGTTAVFVSEGNIWRFEIYSPAGKLLYTVNKWNIGIGEDRCVQKQYSLELPLANDELVCGTGERFNGFDQRGKQIAFWNTDPTYHWYPTSDNLDLWRGYKNIPLIHTGRGCSVFFNTTCNGYMDIGKSDPTRLYCQFDDNRIDFYVWAGNIRDNLVKYTDLTGKQLLPPEWAFHYQAGGSNGFWKCPSDDTPREKYKTTFDNLIAGYKRLGTVPSAIYGEGAVGKDTQSYKAAKKFGTRMLCWNCADCPPYVREKLFPNISAKELPLVKSAFDYDGDPYYFIDFPNEKSGEILNAIHGEKIKAGLSGGMVDFAELVPIDAKFSNGLYGNRMHNFFAYWYAKAYNRLYTSLRGEDFLCYIRAGCAGSQKWLCTWCGDQFAGFDGLKQQLAAGLSISASGFSVWSGDLAGLCGTPSKEVFLRGLQFSTFQPLMRSGGDSTKQPWDFGETAVKVYLKHFWLRENLIPLIYSSAVKSNKTGLPMTEPMAAAFPNDLSVRRTGSEYMFCGEILFSPVLDEGAEKQTVLFPAGSSWYGIFDGTVIQGGQTLEIPVTLEFSPAYIRSGAVIPVKVTESLELMKPLGDDAVYALLITPPTDARRHRYYKESESCTEFTVQKAKGGFSVSASGENGFEYAIILSDVTYAECDGSALKRYGSEKDLCNKNGYAVSHGKTYIHSENGFKQLTVSLQEAE